MRDSKTMIWILLFIVGILFLSLIIIVLLGTSVPYSALIYKPINTSSGYISRNETNLAVVSGSSLPFMYEPEQGFLQALIPSVGVRCLSSHTDNSITYEECIPSPSTSFNLTFAKITQGDSCLVAATDSNIILGSCEDPNVLSIIPIVGFRNP